MPFLSLIDGWGWWGVRLSVDRNNCATSAQVDSDVGVDSRGR
jgi:hypothetical protein